MSGLEPLAALGLACNIMQMISFTSESISVCRQIYNSGQPDPSLNDYCQRLLKTSESLRSGIDQSSGHLASDDQALRDTAEKCINVADNLTKEMQSLSTQSSHKSFRTSFRQGVKTIFRKPRLERLEVELRNIQSAMHTQLLVRTLNRLDASAIEQQGALTASRSLLDDTLRQYSAKHDGLVKDSLETRDQLLQAINAATARIEEHARSELLKSKQSLQNDIGTVAAQTQQHAVNFQEWASNAAKEAAYQRLLQSLKFDSMEERKNHICANYPSTFLWIYERQTATSTSSGSQASYRANTNNMDDVNNADDAHITDCSGDTEDTKNKTPCTTPRGRKYDSFVDWLSSEDLVYWVSGKPGSGKSTLMKFILSNPQTQAGLNEWRPGVWILSHFFWKAGSQLQHSIKGFLCSLVYQVFHQDRTAALQQTQALSHNTTSTSDWDMIQLKEILLEYVCQSTKPICIFVDGLDELMPQSDIQDLLSLLSTLRESGVKLCLSSRPEQVFQNHLRHYATLRMHDLTEPDIITYADGILSQAISRAPSKFHVSSLLYFIAVKAQGVFLWVVLVSKSLARGIENGDSYDELKQRLDSMPSDLMELYRDMWLRSNEDHEVYKATSRWHFNIVLAAEHESDDYSGLVIGCLRRRSVSVFDLMAATDTIFLEQLLNDAVQLSKSEVEKMCRNTANSVESRSGGLLQVFEDDIESYNHAIGDLYDHGHGIWSIPKSTEFQETESLLDNLNQDGSVIGYTSMTVDFIHRTARDYLLETEAGQSLWKADSAFTEEVYSRLVQANLLRYQIWEFAPNPQTPPIMRNSLEAFLDSVRWTRKKTSGIHQTRLLSIIEVAWSRGDLSLTLKRQGKPAETEAQFRASVTVAGFGDHVMAQLRELDSSDEALHSHLLECCKRDIPHYYSKHIADKRLPERDHAIRHLLIQGSNPNPIQGHTPSNRFGIDSGSSPWLSYLVSTLDFLSRLRWLVHRELGRTASEEILETLRVFMESGARLCAGPALLRFGLNKTFSRGHRIKGVDLNNGIEPITEYGVVLSVNASWLIKVISTHLHPGTNIARFDYERLTESSEVLLVTKPGQEAELTTPRYLSDVIYAVDSEKSSILTTVISLFFLTSAWRDEEETEVLEAEFLTKLSGLIEILESGSEPMSLDEANALLEERGACVGEQK